MTICRRTSARSAIKEVKKAAVAVIPEDQPEKKVQVKRAISELVELMGGHLTVTSEVGVGSTFRFDALFDRAAPVMTLLEGPAPAAPTTSTVRRGAGAASDAVPRANCPPCSCSCGVETCTQEGGEEGCCEEAG